MHVSYINKWSNSHLYLTCLLHSDRLLWGAMAVTQWWSIGGGVMTTLVWPGNNDWSDVWWCVVEPCQAGTTCLGDWRHDSNYGRGGLPATHMPACLPAIIRQTALYACVCGMWATVEWKWKWQPRHWHVSGGNAGQF